MLLDWKIFPWDAPNYSSEKEVIIGVRIMAYKRLYNINESEIGDLEREHLYDAFDLGGISSRGTYIEMFESEFAHYNWVKIAVSRSNGAAALHLAVKALGLKEGNEVLALNLTFASPANAVLYERAKPIFVDINRFYWAINPEEVEKNVTEKTRAIIVVHLYGHPVDMGKIMKNTQQYDLMVIEDCAEAHGATFNGKKVGSIGDIGCFFFYGNKIITTGVGGMNTTNNRDLEAKIRILRDHGANPLKRYWHDVVGYNYRITNFQTAICLAQLQSISEKIDKRRWIAMKYKEYLDENIILQPKMFWAKNVYWLPTFILQDCQPRLCRDLIILKMKGRGVETRPIVYPSNEMNPYRSDKDFPNTKYISDREISLPISNKLDEDDVRILSEIPNEEVKMCHSHLLPLMLSG